MKFSIAVFLLYLTCYHAFAQNEEKTKDTSSTRFGNVYLGLQTKILVNEKFKNFYNTNSYNSFVFGAILGKNSGKVFFSVDFGVINLDSLNQNLSIRCFNFSMGYLRQSSITKNMDMRIRLGLNILDSQANSLSMGSVASVGIALRQNRNHSNFAFFDIGFNNQKNRESFYKNFSSWFLTIGLAL